MNETTEIKNWKFAPCKHASQRFLERVFPIVHHRRVSDFCKQARLARPREVKLCRKSSPVESQKHEEKNRIYLWVEEHEIAIVGSPHFTQRGISFEVVTFLDMGGHG